MAHFTEANFYPESSPGYLVRVINQMSVAGLGEALATDDLTTTQWMALISIHFGFADTCVGLARSLAHDKGAMTRLIDAMEERGWVTRSRAPDDRRLVQLALTEAGRDVTLAARRKAIECWNDWLADWSDAEIEGLIATLVRLRDSMEKGGEGIGRCDA